MNPFGPLDRGDEDDATAPTKPTVPVKGSKHDILAVPVKGSKHDILTVPVKGSKHDILAKPTVPVKGSKHDILARVAAHREQGVVAPASGVGSDGAIASIQAAAFAGVPMTAAARKKALKAAKKKARKAQKRQLEAYADQSPQPATSRRKGNVPPAAIGWSGKVSDAFETARFDDALVLLEQGRAQKQIPKLGALQRWVAGLGDGATTQTRSLRLLDALLRVADGLGVALKAPSASGTATFKLNKVAEGYGIKMTSDAVITRVSGVAAAAGLTVGSRILNIDGKPVRRKEEVLACVQRSPPGTPLELTASVLKSAAAPAVVTDGVLRELPPWSATPLRFIEGTSPQESVVSVSKVLASVHKHADSAADSEPATPDTYSDVPPAAKFLENLRVLAHEKGENRTPPNLYDLDIYYPTAGAFPYDALPPQTRRHDVPFVPGAFVLSDVLTPKECRMIMGIAEAAGFVPDQPANVDRKLAAATEAGLGSRAANFTLFADDTLQIPLLERVRALLPQEITGAKLAGLNARWRFYRYLPGAVYRPHIDGAWPASGLRTTDKKLSEAEDEAACRDADGNQVEYVYDASGDRRSRLTFLLYLNEDFEGGCTTFFNADPETIGVVESRGVAPRCGSVLCFPHGEGAGSRVHEGSAVTAGSKYIVRTDVLYTLPQSSGDQKNRNARRPPRLLDAKKITKPQIDKKHIQVDMTGVSNQQPMAARK